jgi:proteic killer suppression protein
LIISFRDKATEDLFHGRETARLRGFPTDMRRKALLKLDMLNAASSPLDLRSPPGNRLEQLKGELRGCYALRINDQWRMVFRFENANALDVRIVDYH